MWQESDGAALLCVDGPVEGCALPVCDGRRAGFDRGGAAVPYRQSTGSRSVATTRASHQPRARHSFSCGRSAPSVVSSPCPG
jgi:hypothetical protein